MSPPVEQQIVISGVGGQGVLFVTRLLAEAAIRLDLPVLTSETHGMAQRGGTVISHLKVGRFTSPLIRRGRADGLIALKVENLAGGHDTYLKPGGWTVVNNPEPPDHPADGPVRAIDADAVAERLGNPRAVNLIVLGYALSRPDPPLFCDPDTVAAVIHQQLADAPRRREQALDALWAGAGGER
jgi:indolepyruvate ferredoxin oxidoreductase, beta subunit